MFTFNTDTREIFIYDEIGPSWWGLIDAAMVIDALAKMDGRVTVRLNTPGGSVDEGISIYNALTRHKHGVTTVVDSLAASMGSYVMLAGDERHIASNAMVMIHEVWTIALGNATEMRRTADILDKYCQRMVPDYSKRSGKSEDEIRSIMLNETWYTGQEAVNSGFATKLLDASDIEPNALGLSRISSKAPENVLRIAARQQKERSERFVKRESARAEANRFSFQKAREYANTVLK